MSLTEEIKEIVEDHFGNDVNYIFNAISFYDDYSHLETDMDEIIKCWETSDDLIDVVDEFNYDKSEIHDMIERIEEIDSADADVIIIKPESHSSEWLIDEKQKLYRIVKTFPEGVVLCTDQSGELFIKTERN